VAAAGGHLSKARLAETSQNLENWERCINWLLGAQPDGWRNLAHRSVGAMLEAWMKGEISGVDGDETKLEVVRRRLAQAGLSLVTKADLDAAHGQVEHLFIPSNHQQVAALFKGSQWSARAGASAGTWSSALRLSRGGIARQGTAKLDGAPVFGTLLRLDRIVTIHEPQEEPGADG
jgi:hypothetical protein